MTELELLENKVAARLGEIEPLAYRYEQPIRGWRYQAGPPYLEAGIPQPDESWKPIALGDAWRPEADTVWFHAVAEVPQGWAGGPLLAQLEIGGEALVFVNGEPRGSVSLQRPEVVLAEEARGGQRFELALEATRWWTHYRAVRTETFARASLATKWPEVLDLLHWARLALQAALCFPTDATERMRIVRLLDAALKRVELRKAGSPEFVAQAAAAAREIAAGLGQIGPGGPGNITLVGHAHIDTAWLWPLSETKRKCARTFCNVLELMKRYPDFRFTQSQPQLYKFTKELFPEVFARIKHRVASGQWEPVGGAWVECDCNLPSGEALIRQLLYGKRFLRSELGVDTEVGWWPDAFGYAWSLPQILAHCGIKYFFTTKISWNQYNTFPRGVFWWRGLDGTRLLSFHATGTYCGEVTPAQLTRLWREFPDRDRVDHCLHSFGYGDGGGGPTVEMVERARRLGAMPGVPKCRMGRADEFFAHMAAQATDLPTWDGELYLELHRGCQTTQARTKRGNRKLELALRDVELLSALALLKVGTPYPTDALQEMWERLLCYQFHDILPGSSVRQVYEEVEADYARMLDTARGLRTQMMAALAGQADTTGEGQAVVVFNTLGWTRTDPVEITLKAAGDEFHAVGPDGRRVPCQVLRRQGDELTLLFLAQVPPFGYSVYHICPGGAPAESVAAASHLVLENPFLRVECDPGGRVVSVHDKRAGREVLATGQKGNLLQLFEDRPMNYDAWDIDPWFEDQQWEVPEAEKAEVVEAGPVRASLRFHRRTERSTIIQEVQLYAHLPRLDFVTRVDWHERKTLLKVAFPVEVLARQATYEIPFGAIERPTHDNTSWDRARFEVPAHRWADLSEHRYGVALLNDCKYGYDVKGHTLRLSLLRSPTDPDTEADQGEHEFVYSLYPHEGNWREAAVVRRAMELNAPLLAVTADAHPGEGRQWASVSCDHPDVVLETLKRAEDPLSGGREPGAPGDLILRVYECHGGRGRVNITFSLPFRAAAECNGMEEDIAPADFSRGTLSFSIAPWQIRSFRLTP